VVEGDVVEGNSEPAVAITDPHARPEWADSATIYEVYVRSFAGDTLPTTFAEIERPGSRTSRVSGSTCSG